MATTNEPVVIVPELYWKLRTHMADHQRVVERCNRLVTESQQVLNGDMTACGLDPWGQYRLNDETLTATREPETR